MKKSTHHIIAEVPRRQRRVEMTIGIDLGDVWSHFLQICFTEKTRVGAV
jgi:transposase